MEALFAPSDFKKYFYACLILAVFCFVGALLAISSSGLGNSFNSHIAGYGQAQIRHDINGMGDYAGVEQGRIDYTVGILWGVASAQTIDSNYHINATYADYRNSYRIYGQGGDHTVRYTAEKQSGDNSFANKISLVVTEAGEENFDSTIMFDTRYGNASISARVINWTTGQPATMADVNLVGQFLLEENLNISKPAFTPEGWLGNCAELNKIIDAKVAKGIYIAPPGYALDESGNLYAIDATAKKVIGASQ